MLIIYIFRLFKTGFGDIHAWTDLERVFTIFSICIGTGVFATIIGKLSAVASEKDIVQIKKQERFEKNNILMKFRMLPKVTIEWTTYDSSFHPFLFFPASILLMCCINFHKERPNKKKLPYILVLYIVLFIGIYISN